MRFSCRSIRARKLGRLIGLAKGSGVVGAELGLCAAWLDSLWIGFASLTFVAFAMTLLARALSLRTWAVAGEIVVAGGEIELRAGPLSTRARVADVESSYRLWRSALPRSTSHTSDEAVIVFRGGLCVSVRLEHEADAEALVTALGFGEQGRTVRFPVGGLAASTPLGQGLALVMTGFFGALAAVSWMVGLLLLASSAILLAVVSTAATLLAWGAARARQVEVGTDGVTVHGPATRVFYAYRDLALERSGVGDLTLRLVADGRRVPLVGALGDERAFASLRAYLERAWRRACEPGPEPRLHEAPPSSSAFRARELDELELSDILADPRLSRAARIEAGRMLCLRDPSGGMAASRAVAEASCDEELRAELVRLAG